jgi:CubicO group peptidase (beta-lactamase class C family)
MAAMKKRWTLAGLLTAATTVGLALFYFQNRVYWERYSQLRADGTGDVDIYSPTEKVEGGAAVPFPLAAPGESEIPSETLAEARRYAAEARSTSLLIWHKGRLVSADYWGGVTRETPVNSRSLHKMLGGLLIGAAIQQGKVKSLDDSVADYITEWKGKPQAAMRIRDVLQMASGMMWFGGGGAYSLASRRYLDPYWDRILLERVPMGFAPGTAYDYGDITADIMPHIIERATGRRYADYLGDTILKPIGAAGGSLWINREGGMPHGGCCLLVPPETWLHVGLLVLNNGRIGDRQIVPEWWVREMTTPSPNNPHFGLMVWLGEPYAQRRLYARPDAEGNQRRNPGVYHSEPYIAKDLILFDGLNGQIVYIMPSRELVIVRTGLRPPPGKPEWDNAYLPNLILRGLGDPTPKPSPPPQIAPKPVRTLSFAQKLGEEWLFFKRWFTIGVQTPRSIPDWLTASETVKGVDDDRVLQPAGKPTISQAALNRAEAYARERETLSLLVWHEGRMALEIYGETFHQLQRSETYSMAKSVTGLAIGAAIGEGKIRSIDDPAVWYLPEWKGTLKETISLRQLLNHTSGLAHYPFNNSLWQNPGSEGLRLSLGTDFESVALNAPVETVPGAVFNYNSINSQLLVAAIERATGERYADFLSRALWTKIGAAPALLWLDRPGGVPRGYASLIARPRDWLKLGILIAQGGVWNGVQVIPADYLKEMTTPSAKNPNYGLHLWLGSPKDGKRRYNRNTAAAATHSAPYLADDVVFFDGGGGHRVYVVPSRNLVIVRTAARNRIDWDDAMLPNLILEGIGKD